MVRGVERAGGERSKAGAQLLVQPRQPPASPKAPHANTSFYSHQCAEAEAQRRQQAALAAAAAAVAALVGGGASSGDDGGDEDHVAPPSAK